MARLLPNWCLALIFTDWQPVGSARQQTPGGTGALRIGAEFIHTFRPNATVWLPNPTWGNHKNIFARADCPLNSYPYYNAEFRQVDADAMCAALEDIPAGDVVVLHVCCHNPTGADPDAETWERIADIAARRGWLPFFDFAYQGFSEGLVEDRAGMMAVLKKVPEALVASSFSKNMACMASGSEPCSW